MRTLVASVGRLIWGALLLLNCIVWVASAAERASLDERDSSYDSENQHAFSPIRSYHVPKKPSNSKPTSTTASFTTTITATNALQELHNALQVMQSEYFSLWLGKWTTAIDWTAAVMGTHMTAALSTLSHSVSYTMPGTFDKERKLDVEAQMVENEINRYFSQTITYYFGEDHFAIRMQAYDDMLWVVLGWLDSIQFIRAHSALHYPSNPSSGEGMEREWHAKQFIPVFAHRARIFYELAAKGWDWHLCGGGMTWNPRLLPYKNAITNELFISASMSMYLHFPGDDNCSPFLSANESSLHFDGKFLRGQEQGHARACDGRMSSDVEYDPVYLQSAINGYHWLKSSGMTSEKGLYVDGFHIRGYAQNHSKTECDERNEMVYTYNQGVLLSGLRGLWEATGNTSYLEDGHELIRNVIRATGWTDTDRERFVTFDRTPGRKATKTTGHTDTHEDKKTYSSDWYGLGSHGILTELCDPYGTCSQNGHTFKGIFFHHLTTFCQPLPRTAARPGKTVAASDEVAKLHQLSCNEYAPWVMHNGVAALGTKDRKGRFGSWWGASLFDQFSVQFKKMVRREGPEDILPEGAVDYRKEPVEEEDAGRKMRAMADRGYHPRGDLNDRGRGRTVETQGGGVAVTRAMWEFLKNYEGNV